MAEKKTREEKKQAKEDKKKQKQAAKEKKKAAGAGKSEESSSPDQSKAEAKEGKPGILKRLTASLGIRKIVPILLILLAVGAASFTVYHFYFSSDNGTLKYRETAFENVDLPPEMLKFSFRHMKKLYDHLETYNRYISLIDAEMERIKKIGSRYPDQEKIVSDRQEEWTGRKEDLKKVYEDIEDEIKDLYVLFHVNRDQGKKRITDTKEKLVSKAANVLKEMEPHMQKLANRHDQAPDGVISGTIQKIKNIF